MFALAHTHSTVCGCLLQTLSDELRVDASTRQLVHEWVHQSHTSCIPPSLCLSVAHLRVTRRVKTSTKSVKRVGKDVKLCYKHKFLAVLICASLALTELSPVCKRAPTLKSILMILHFSTANHGIRTQITNEIRTLEAFTDNQSHASSELGAAVWVTMSPLRDIVRFKQHHFKTTLKVWLRVYPHWMAFRVCL